MPVGRNEPGPLVDPLRKVPMNISACALLALAGTLVAVPFRVPPGMSRPPGAGDCVVHRVTDGDTLRCRDGRRIRLIGIDAPEFGQAPYGARARAGLETIANKGTTLRVELDVSPTDRYGRTLAYLWTGSGTLVNEAMAERGLAVPLAIPPNVRHMDRIRAAAARARAGRRGLWATPAFNCAPADYRARRCS